MGMFQFLAWALRWKVVRIFLDRDGRDGNLMDAVFQWARGPLTWFYCSHVFGMLLMLTLSWGNVDMMWIAVTGILFGTLAYRKMRREFRVWSETRTDPTDTGHISR